MRFSRPLVTHGMYALPDDRMATYNCIDIRATAAAAVALRREAAERDMLAFFERWVFPLTEPVMDMQKRGLTLSIPHQTALRAQLTAELAKVDAEILAHDPTGRLAKPTPKSPNSLNSTKALAWFLYEHLGLKPTKRTASEKSWSTDQAALLGQLQSLRKRDEPARPVLYNLLHRSRTQTLLERYVSLVPDPDGRVRPRIKMTGTETGRFAYDDPPLQQYPEDVRGIFWPAPGHVFVGGDYSQLEARISAFLTHDPVDLRIFAEGLDIHAETARSLFQWGPTEWEAMPPERRKAARNYAKTFRYGLLYGGGPETMRMKTYCPCPRCETKLPPTLDLPRVGIVAASQRWLSEHACILVWRDRIGKVVSQMGCVSTPLGRKRYLFEPWPRCKRSAWNCPIQATAADIINRAMLTLWQRYRAPLFLQMHDYLGVEVPEGETELWLDRLREVMEEPIPEMDGMVFPVEMKVERPWGTEVSQPTAA